MRLSKQQRLILALARVNQVGSGHHIRPAVTVCLSASDSLVVAMRQREESARQLVWSIRNPWVLQPEQLAVVTSPCDWVYAAVETSQICQSMASAEQAFTLSTVGVRGMLKPHVEGLTCQYDLNEQGEFFLIYDCQGGEQMERIAQNLATAVIDHPDLRVTSGYTRPGSADLWFSECMADIGGLRPFLKGHAITSRRLPHGGLFDRKTIGEGTYNRINASLWRSIRRLKDHLAVQTVERDTIWSGTKISIHTCETEALADSILADDSILAGVPEYQKELQRLKESGYNPRKRAGIVTD